MDSKPLSIGKILYEKQRFVVPVYQRTYAWTIKDQLRTFFEQVQEKAIDRIEGRVRMFSHYMGALIVIPEGDAVFGTVQSYNVVDGQQRLTTFYLFYAALRDIAQRLGFEQMARQLQQLLVISDDEIPQEERLKIQPTRRDKDLIYDLVNSRLIKIKEDYAEHFYANGNIKESSNLRPLAAYGYFYQAANNFVSDAMESAEARLRALSTALYEDFRLIVITLDKDDDAQVIFQTLNFGGKPLAAMDLVRNDVFHRAKGQEAYVEERWLTFDVDDQFWSIEDSQGRIKKPRYDFYLGHTLAAETGDDVTLSELYISYRNYIRDKRITDPATELDLLTRYAQVYRKLVEPEGDDALSRLARRLKVFEMSTAYPLVFVIAAGDADLNEKRRCYEIIESYIVRRALCYLTPKNYNKTFATLAATMRQNGVSSDALGTEFTKLGGDTVRFPTDADVREAILTRPQYGWIRQSRLKMILSELEFAMRDKFDESAGLREDLTIEHILPDDWRAHWPAADGRYVPSDQAAAIDEDIRQMIVERDKLKHTLGNLTLLTPAANPSLGNSGFQVKKSRLKTSLLRMNQEVAALETWDGSEIRARSERLAGFIVKLWPNPPVSAQEVVVMAASN